MRRESYRTGGFSQIICCLHKFRFVYRKPSDVRMVMMLVIRFVRHNIKFPNRAYTSRFQNTPTLECVSCLLHYMMAKLLNGWKRKLTHSTDG